MARTTRSLMLFATLGCLVAATACQLGDPVDEDAADPPPGEQREVGEAYDGSPWNEKTPCWADVYLYSRTDGLVSTGSYWSDSEWCQYPGYVELLGSYVCEAQLCGCDSGPDLYCHSYAIQNHWLVSETDYECEGICNH